MKTQKAEIPPFKDEDAEREFWSTHSPLDFFDASKALKAAFSSLKPE